MLLKINKTDSYCTFIRLLHQQTKAQKPCVNQIATKQINKKISSRQATPQSSTTKKTSDSGKRVKASDLKKVEASQKEASFWAEKRRATEKSSLKSYLSVCVDTGHVNQAFKLLVKYNKPRANSVLSVEHYNIILKGWAQVFFTNKVTETRMHMIKNNVSPNTESYAYILLAHTKGLSSVQKKNAKKLIEELNLNGVDTKKIFQTAYLSPEQRDAVRKLLKNFDSRYNDTFCDEPIDYDCKLTQNLAKIDQSIAPDNLICFPGSDKLESWAMRQRDIESKSSLIIKSVAKAKESATEAEKYDRLWKKFHLIWRRSIAASLEQNLKNLKPQFNESDKIHLYPYLYSIDKELLLNLVLDEIETNAVFSSYSMSTYNLHTNLGIKVMTRYFRSKSIIDGSHQEKQKIYSDYLKEYCSNPALINRMNSREFIQTRALKTKNYGIYKEKFAPSTPWPNFIVASIGKFLYGIMLHEVKFDPDVVKNPNKDINLDNMVHAFYTAYFQIDSTHKIKEEFRAHQEFDLLHHRCCCVKLKFDYSFLPSSSPPMPWLSSGTGGYLTNKSDLIRIPGIAYDQSYTSQLDAGNQKLYPSLDSLNALSLCPWIVNKEILDIVIELFRNGGDTDLTVPLDESKMKLTAPVLKENASKASRILYNREKKKYDQRRKEMYSLWRDCLYRLSIANHFKDRVFWFPHNMDFRGRTYPIPPHFNHLGSDLARSLLLFANGRPLGENGLDWLKIHLINLVGNKKSCPLHERLEYANSILHLEVLDSADNPWNGRRWWARNENPWQVLACCKEIAKAIRSKNPQQYISHFPVHQDGSCNGLQHYAALGRDPSGGKAVNLVPCDRPQDVYSRVVDIVEELRQRDAEKGLKEASLLEGFVQRKVIKQTVMTTVYGVTRYGARHQIARQLTAKNYPEQEVWRTAQYLATKTFESIGKMFNKSRLIQNWFTQCAGIIASQHKQPVSWATPLGFPVTQPYKHSKKANISSLILSPSANLDKQSFYESTVKLNTSKQRTAFPPNYIHSLDSTHMMLTSLYCQRHGVTFVSVHDCFWTHPSTVDLMNQICREQFVAMHSEPLLKNLSEEFMQRFDKSVEEGSFMNNVPSAPPAPAPLSSSASSSSSTGRHLRLMQAQPLIEAYESERQASAERIRSIFKEVPKTGDLNLKVVLKSTYFFS